MNTYYMGIDASKGYSDFVILNENKKVVLRNFRLDDTADGHGSLEETIRNFLEENPGEIRAGLESTGGYENNWMAKLKKLGALMKVKVARLNPQGVKANATAGLQRNKTDKISAQDVAKYLIVHAEKVNYDAQDEGYKGLRRMWKALRLLVKQQAQLFNQLESLVYNSSPEVLAYCRNGFPRWVLKLLEKYPTAKHIAESKEKDLSKLPYITSTRARALIAKAKESVASAEDDAIASTIQGMVGDIFQRQERIDRIGNEMETAVRQKDSSDLDMLVSVPGIGVHSAIGLLIEFEDVSRFPTVKEFSSNFGLHPRVTMSGDGMKISRMSKKGRKEARTILYMSALVAMRSNPYLREIYESHVKKGMAKKAAVGVIMHKLLRIIYGMLKNGKPFDVEVDRRYRERTIISLTQKSLEKNGTHSAVDGSAPISKREMKKRKERAQSQGALGPKNGIKEPSPQDIRITS